MTLQRIRCVPAQLADCGDGSPEQVVILHGEVRNSAIGLRHIEERKEVGSIEHGGVGRKAGQSNTVVVCCQALVACIGWHSCGQYT